MVDDFKKMDEFFQKIFREQSENFSPEKNMKGFSDSVVKKILERQRSRQIGFSLALGFSAAAILGLAMVVVIQQKQMPVAEAPEKMEAQAPAVITNEIAAPEAIQTESAKPAAPAVRETVTAETIAADIEALKELGLWTEQDEEAIGIPVETAFSEVMTYLETEQPAISMPPQQAAG